MKKRPANFLVSLLGAALLVSAAVSAQQGATPSSPPATPTATGQAPPAAKTFTQQDLDQLLAPIALYPDNLLAQILMASTYPLEVVLAARWLRDNPNVKDKALEDAMQKQTWDPSVKGLTAVPQVLKQMDEKIDWTQKLGDAFLAQQAEVMTTVQSLRAKANESGNLKSTPEMAVKTETVNEKTVYVIESTKTETVYVPTYNPSVVYGAWPYPAYPPYYMYPPYYAYAPGITFTAGIFVGAAIWGGCGWGGNDVYINHNNYNNFNRTDINNDIGNGDRGNGDRGNGDRGNGDRGNGDRGNGDRGNGDRGNGGRGNGDASWKHNADHRGGVPYRDQNTASQYGRGSENRPQSSDSFRGRDQGGGADRPGGGADRPGGGADRPGGGADRPSGGADRPSASAGTRDTGSRDTGSRDTGSRNTGSRDTGSRGGSSRSSGGGGFSGMSSGGGARAASSRGGSSFGGGGRGGGGRRR